MECTKDIECLRELVGAAVCTHNGIEYTDGQSWSRVSCAVVGKSVESRG